MQTDFLPQLGLLYRRRVTPERYNVLSTHSQLLFLCTDDLRLSAHWTRWQTLQSVCYIRQPLAQSLQHLIVLGAQVQDVLHGLSTLSQLAVQFVPALVDPLYLGVDVLGLGALQVSLVQDGQA